MFGFAHRPVAGKQGPVSTHSARFQETNQAFRFGKKGSILEILISFFFFEIKLNKFEN